MIWTAQCENREKAKVLFFQIKADFSHVIPVIAPELRM